MMYTMPKNLLSICVNFTLATQPVSLLPAHIEWAPTFGGGGSPHPRRRGKRVDTCGFYPMIFTSFPNGGMSLEKRTELR